MTFGDAIIKNIFQKKRLKRQRWLLQASQIRDKAVSLPLFLYPSFRS